MTFSRGTIMFAIGSLIAAFVIVYGLNAQPELTDSFYHYNAAVRVVEGDGFVDDYLWIYIGAPDSLPAPSHLYWMPGTTMILTVGMFVFGTTYAAAQIGLALCLWGAALLTYWLGWRLGGSARHAWQAGIMLLCGGFFMRVWGQSDTFAPYAFFGAITIVFIGLAIQSEKHTARWWVLAGTFSAFSHLIRNDGLIMLLVGWSVLFWPLDFIPTFTKKSGDELNLSERKSLKTLIPQRLLYFVIFTTAYLVAMSPWMIRNLSMSGAPLPVGGAQGAWFTEYDDLFKFEQDVSPQRLFADGGRLFFETRRVAIFSANGALLHFIGEQGIIVLTPFVFIGLWVRRRDDFIRPVWIFALGMHLAFTLVFPFQGIRGGQWHASAALMPFWTILALVGLDSTIDWMATVRRKWNPRTAKPIFSNFMMLLIVVVSLYFGITGRFTHYTPNSYRRLIDAIPAGARVMINDPARMYYHTCTIGTCIGGVVIPSEPPEVALDIAEIYDVDYLVLENGGVTESMQFDDGAADFFTPILDLGGATLYAIRRD